MFKQYFFLRFKFEEYFSKKNLKLEVLKPGNKKISGYTKPTSVDDFRNEKSKTVNNF